MINWIICPIISNLINEPFNMFGSQGLVYDLFYLAITNALLPPLVRFLNPMTLIRKIIALWKNRPCRYSLIQTKK